MNWLFVFNWGDVLTVLAVVIGTGVGAVFGFKSAIEEYHCKHDNGVNETGKCDAICRKCGKNLGFIGNWHKRNKP